MAAPATTKGSAKDMPLTMTAIAKKNELDAVSKVQTTAGGSLWADMPIEGPSTKDDSDGAASGGSELETVTGTDRTGKSRSSATKSSGRKRNRLERHKKFLEKKILAEGGTFTWEAEQKPYLMTAEERDAATSCGSSAQHKAAIESINKQGRLDLMSRVIPQVPSPPPNITPAEVEAVERRCETQPDYCGACSKWMSDSHRTSKQHQQKIGWHISCDRLMGPTAGPRVYSSGLPLPDDLVLRDTDLVRWWGKDTMSMHVLAQSILRTKGIKVRVAKRRAEEHIPGTGIQGCSLAFVEFDCGSGKYESGKSRLRWPHQLPAVLPDRRSGTWWPVAIVSFVDDIEKRIRQDWMESEAAGDM